MLWYAARRGFKRIEVMPPHPASIVNKEVQLLCTQ